MGKVIKILPESQQKLGIKQSDKVYCSLNMRYFRSNDLTYVPTDSATIVLQLLLQSSFKIGQNALRFLYFLILVNDFLKMFYLFCVHYRFAEFFCFLQLHLVYFGFNLAHLANGRMLYFKKFFKTTKKKFRFLSKWLFSE